jgi:hypothetical protein
MSAEQDLQAALETLHKVASRIYGPVTITLNRPNESVSCVRYPLASVDEGPSTYEASEWAAGRKINTIKEIRSRTGIGLKEAKDLAEHWAAEGKLPKAHDPFAPGN